MTEETQAELIKTFVGDAEWLGLRTRQGDILGIAIQDGAVALSDGKSWIRCPLSAFSHVLKMHLGGGSGISLVATDIPSTVSQLTQAVGLPAQTITERFLGDLTGIAHCTGIPFTDQNDVVGNATAALLLWRAHSSQVNVPSYYQKIAVPLQKIKAVPVNLGKRWHVQYPELLWRVISHMTHDPRMIRVSHTDDILKRIRDEIAGGDHELAKQYILYTSTGFDREFFAKRFGDPPDHSLDAVLEERLPNVRLAALTAWGDAVAIGYASTLYGRKLPVSASSSVGETLWFMLGGTVQDILEVASITFANAGASIDYRHWASDADYPKIEGTVPANLEQEFVVGSLPELAPLAGPLGAIPLNPVIGRYT